jgi:hypothetical protein
MRHPRNILAVAVVAVALCADRTVAAGSTGQRPHVGETLAGQIVRKLHNSLRRIVPSADPFQARAVRLAAPAHAARHVPTLEADVPPVPLSPFCFRLPPPANA